MQIIYDEYPPNYKEIAKVFDIRRNPGIVFTYGDKLYVPGGKGVIIDPHLMKHEETHSKQQADIGVEEWWKRYLVDSDFRLTEEVEAYRNQYRSMGSLTSQQRVSYLNHIIQDLSGAMYGSVVTPQQALELITNGIVLKHPSAIKKSGISARKLKKRQRQNRKKGRK